MWEIDTAGNAILLELSNNLLFVSGGESDGIAVYDVTGPMVPMLVGGLSPG